MKNKNLLSKKLLQLIKEGWNNDILNKYKKQFNEFFIKLKEQFEYNSKANTILLNYLKTGTITKDETVELKTIITDTLKMVGLGSIALLPIPGGTLLMLYLINSAKKLGIDIIPSKFNNN